MIVSLPGVTPVTEPATTVAFALEALHTPPVAVALKAVEAAVQRVAAPVIAGLGTESIAIAKEVVLVLHPEDTEYWIVSIPEVTPVTVPSVATVALLLVA